MVTMSDEAHALRSRENAGPVIELVSRYGFAYGRHIRQHSGAFCIGDRQYPEPAGFDVRHRCGRTGKQRFDLAAKQIDDGRTAALVRYVHKVDLRQYLELFAT